MNFLPNTYFPLFYPYPAPETSEVNLGESFYPDDNQKYIKLLESENKLLK